MAARKPPGPGMRWLCQRVNEVGAARYADIWRAVHPSRIERWMQSGLLPQPARPGRGRARGRTVVYTDDHVDATVEVWGLMRRYRSVDKVLVVLLARGWDVEIAALRRALLALLQKTRDEVAGDVRQARAELKVLDKALAAPSSSSVPGPSPSESIEAATSLTGRRLGASRLAPAIGAQAPKPLYRAYEDMALPVIQILIGFVDVDLTPIAEALGLSLDADEVGLPDDTYRALETALLQAGLDELRQALAVWPALVKAADGIAEATPLVSTADALAAGASEFSAAWVQLLTALTVLHVMRTAVPTAVSL